MQILVVPTEAYKKARNKGKFSFRKFLNTNFLYIDRELAETNEAYLQIIPYILVKRGPEIFTYRRLKGSGETRLHGKYSVGIGGHVDLEVGNQSISSSADVIVESAAYRELFEELDIEETSQILELKYEDKLVYDPSNDVGRVHLGVVYSCDVGGRTVEVGEPDKIEGQFRNINDLQKAILICPEEFEAWTQIVLREVV